MDELDPQSRSTLSTTFRWIGRVHGVLVIIGGVFVMEAGSVILQVASFKIRKKRIFRMSPIHHHFELTGWPETTVIIRFWLISAICVGCALAIFIGDYTAQVG